MGSDRNYLCVEPAEESNADDIESRLTTGDTFDVWSTQYNETVIAVGYDGDHEPALQRLQELEDAVQRAFLLHVYDTVMSSVGWVYERTADGFVEREEITGAERYGIDVVDYVKREYDINGPR